MDIQVEPTLAAAAPHGCGLCPFCGNAVRSETQAEPTWLDLAFPGRPILACAACNSGWISGLGATVLQFLEPALQGQPARLSHEQVTALAGCVCLVAINAAFQARHCGISAGDRSYLRQTGRPPKNWSIFIAGLSETGWSRTCTHHPYRIEFSGNPCTTHSKSRTLMDCNTQLLSIGMGPLFFHIFSSPSLLLLNDFDASAKSHGLTRLWPAPRRFGVLAPTSVKIPPDVSLTDAQAAAVAESFAIRLRQRLPGTRSAAARRAPAPGDAMGQLEAGRRA
jgi:hypothetical protein